MTDSDPDYTECTLEELRDVRRVIDDKAFPERVRTVYLLIRDREQAAKREPQRVSIADEEGKIAAVTLGRGVLFGQGVAEIVSSLVFLGVVFLGFIDLDNPNMRTFAAFAVFVSIAGIITGGFHTSICVCNLGAVGVLTVDRGPSLLTAP